VLYLEDTIGEVSLLAVTIRIFFVIFVNASPIYMEWIG
jgi:hypothetical protein